MFASGPLYDKFRCGWLHLRLLRRYRPQSAAQCPTIWERTDGTPPNSRGGGFIVWSPPNSVLTTVAAGIPLVWKRRRSAGATSASIVGFSRAAKCAFCSGTMSRNSLPVEGLACLRCNTSNAMQRGDVALQAATQEGYLLLVSSPPVSDRRCYV